MIMRPTTAPSARLGGNPRPTARLGGNPPSLYPQMSYPQMRWRSGPASGRYPQRPALPGLAIATVQMVATHCAPALPGLAIATSGNLDFSSGVNIGEGPGRHGR